ncbi:MAG: hypothetical protein M0Z34_00550 [Nitrospiraceae bacterium]|nr:hypothetical protein [Nitrospiraceae bacterium]
MHFCGCDLVSFVGNPPRQHWYWYLIRSTGRAGSTASPEDAAKQAVEIVLVEPAGRGAVVYLPSRSSTE